MTQKSRASLIFIFLVVFIDAMGFGIVIPVIPSLIQQLTGEGVSHASQVGSWLLFCYAILQFAFSPFLGALSDKIGRRPVLLFALFGLSIDYALQGWAPSLLWLFVGRAIAGIGGASVTTASAYIADVSAPEDRSKNFGLIGVAFGLGFIIGPALGGFASEWGIRAPFYVAAVLTFLNFLYGIFIIPESLAPENRRPIKWGTVVPFKSVFYFKKYKVVFGLLGASFLTYLASHAVQSNWTFFTTYKFNWGPKMISYSLTFVGLIVALVQGGLIRIVIPRIGERKAVYVGFVFYVIGLVSFGLASASWMMFAFVILYALGGLSQPAASGLMANAVPANEQGELQGATTSIIGLTAFMGPIVMNNLFAYFTSEDAPYHFPEIPFFVGALLDVLAVLVVIWTFREIKKQVEDSSPESIDLT